MLPLYQDPWFTFRFADDRIISCFHLEGVEAGRFLPSVRQERLEKAIVQQKKSQRQNQII